jgi:lysophospholipase L1-like esterase
MPRKLERRSLRYVALGDSYTIGTSVREAERWPNQLVDRLPGRLRLTANLGVDGFTSRDVLARELTAYRRLDPEFATLLIGVNDVVQGVPAEGYARNVAVILDQLLAALPPNRIVTVSTPDYTVTPEGASYGEPVARRAAIVAFNGILRAAAESRGVAFVDVHDVSREARDDPSLVASDGLHPSGAQYALWVDRIAPVVDTLLRD